MLLGRSPLDETKKKQRTIEKAEVLKVPTVNPFI